LSTFSTRCSTRASACTDQPDGLSTDHPTADKLINDSITSGDPAAVKAEAAFFTTDQPSMFEPNTDYTWEWKTTLSAQKTGSL
jgi:hypothetical protein